MANLRIRFVLDEDAQFEECNGEARPLTAKEYAENVYRGCPNHPRSKWPPFRADDKGHAWCGECGTRYADIPYAEYLAYHGNPERHVYLGYEMQEQCTCCSARKTVDSLWDIDMMDDAPELRAITLGRWYDLSAPEITGYFRTLVDEAEVK